MTDYIKCPFTVAIDTREQAAWGFTGFRADAAQKHKPLLIPVQEATLRTGDYSIQGFEDRITVERKSLGDALATFSADRDRFERELTRMQEMDFSAVVVEAGWNAVLERHHEHCKVSPKAIYRSVIAWQQRFPKTHWWWADTRTRAEHTAFRILERFYLDEMERIKQHAIES